MFNRSWGLERFGMGRVGPNRQHAISRKPTALIDLVRLLARQAAREWAAQQPKANSPKPRRASPMAVPPRCVRPRSHSLQARRSGLSGAGSLTRPSHPPSSAAPGSWRGKTLNACFAHLVTQRKSPMKTPHNRMENHDGDSSSGKHSARTHSIYSMIAFPNVTL